MPSPNVDSTVIRLDIKRGGGLSADTEKRLFRLIRAGFSQRRKQLVNPLSAELRIAKSEVSALLEGAGIKPAARAEELTLDDYIKLAEKLR